MNDTTDQLPADWPVPPRWVDPVAQPGQPYVIPQLTEEDMEGWSKWKVDQARKAGRLRQLHGMGPEWANHTYEALLVRLPQPGQQWQPADVQLALHYGMEHTVRERREAGDLDQMRAQAEAELAHEARP